MLMSAKSPAILSFHHQYSLVSVLHTEPLFLNHILVLLQRILSKNVIINLRKCIILSDCDSVECKTQQGVLIYLLKN